VKGKKQRFLTFLGLPVDEKLLFLESLSLHLWVGFLMKFIPFKKISVWFANPSGKQVVPSKDTLEKIKSAGIRASRVSPWKKQMPRQLACHPLYAKTQEDRIQTITWSNQS
jgi:hypothetical protein